MRDTSLDPVAAVVLERYPALLTRGVCRSLGNHGGFSGARLWRIDNPAGSLCLRAWPSGAPTPERLSFIHHCMMVARATGLAFVPAVFPGGDGATWQLHGERLWELSEWLPGTADRAAPPSAVHLAAAAQALARLHVAWASVAVSQGSCPAVQRRLDRAADWLRLLRSRWRPSFEAANRDPVAPWAGRAWNLLQGQVERIPAQLASWSARPLPLQACLCDVWRANVLFDGDAVSGIIDYGGMKTDHISVDLARLIGSLAGDDEQLWKAGLEAYRAVRPLSTADEELARVLDTTGTLLAAANWLRWLYHDRDRRFEDRGAVAERLAALVRRVERWRR